MSTSAKNSAAKRKTTRTVELPSNVEAERACLGAAMVEVSALSIVMSSLDETTFSNVDPRNKLVFRAIRELAERKTTVDPATVHGELVSLKLDKEVGSPEYLLNLVDSVIDPDNVEHYVKIVRDQATLRELLLACKGIQEDYETTEIPDIGDFVMAANQRIATVADSRQVGDFKTAAQAAKELEIKLGEMQKPNSDGLTGITTGYKKLNLFTHGWQKEDMIIVAARPSVGKTALTMNLAFNAALYGKATVGFFSLEMNSTLIMQRLVASRACVSNDHIQTGMLTSAERIKVRDALREIASTKLYIDDTPNSMLGDITAKATKLKAAHPDLGLIVIDYLGRIRMAGGGRMESRQQEVSIISGALKTLARSLHVPVIVVSQLNRAVENSESKKPMLSNLRESGSVEQDADIVLLLYRSDYYSPDQLKKKSFGKGQDQPEEKPEPKKETGPGDVSVMEISVAKNRNGKTGDLQLIFEKAFSRFSDPAPQFEEAMAMQRMRNGDGD
ncbi:MAG: replicative DNA helicase [Bacilli bacterium]|nr:replicative DNA helicase [Bacilli bacterium]